MASWRVCENPGGVAACLGDNLSNLSLSVPAIELLSVETGNVLHPKYYRNKMLYTAGTP